MVGGWSIKVAAVVRRIKGTMHSRPGEKCLVFSQVRTRARQIKQGRAKPCDPSYEVQQVMSPLCCIALHRPFISEMGVEDLC